MTNDIISITVLSLCRNNEKWLPFFFQRMEKISEKFEIDYVFVENGSSDLSLSMIKNFLKHRNGRLIQPSITNLELDSMPRIKKMVYLRNLGLNNIRPIHSEYLLIIDSDIYFNKETIPLLIEPFILLPNKIGAVCSYGIAANIDSADEEDVKFSSPDNHYYDTFTFLCADNILNWPYCLSPTCNMCKDLIPKKSQWKANESYQIANSAFGGMQLVPKNIINNEEIRYDTFQFNDEIIKATGHVFACEHLLFCEKIREQSGLPIIISERAKVLVDLSTLTQ